MGAIATFFLGLVLAVRQVITSTNSNYESVALDQDEEAEQIWVQKEQPPAYIEQEQEQSQEEEKKPFLA